MFQIAYIRLLPSHSLQTHLSRSSLQRRYITTTWGTAALETSKSDVHFSDSGENVQNQHGRHTERNKYETIGMSLSQNQNLLVT